MYRILRSINQTAKGLATKIPRLATTKELLVQHPHVLFRRTSTKPPHQPVKDIGVPNPSWSQEMMDQFEKFTKMSEDGLWQHAESYADIMAEGPRKEGFRTRKHYYFLRRVGEEGQGFEYAMFLNRSEKRVVSIFQVGPYLEGNSGIAHGGAVATLLDHTMGASVVSVSPNMMTANLSINFKSPVLLGSVVLVDARVDRIEGRKVFLSGEIRSVDGQTLYAEATCLCIKLRPPSTDSSSSP